MSRIGKKPVPVPRGVKVDLQGNTILGRGRRSHVKKNVVVEGQYPFGGSGMVLCHIDNQGALFHPAS